MSIPTALHTLIEQNHLIFDFPTDDETQGTHKMYSNGRFVHLTFSKEKGWGIEKEPDTVSEYAKKIIAFTLRYFLTAANTLTFGIIPYFFQLETPTSTEVEYLLKNRKVYVEQDKIDPKIQKQINAYITHRVKIEGFGSHHTLPPTFFDPCKTTALTHEIKARVHREIDQIANGNLTSDGLFFLLKVYTSYDKEKGLQKTIKDTLKQHRQKIEKLLEEIEQPTNEQRTLIKKYNPGLGRGRFAIKEAPSKSPNPSSPPKTTPKQPSIEAPSVTPVQGIRNGANFCWMISSLQMLFASEHFRGIVRSSQETNPTVKELKSFLEKYEKGEDLHASMIAITTALYNSDTVADFSVKQPAKLNKLIEEIQNNSNIPDATKQSRINDLNEQIRDVSNMRNQFDPSFALEGIFATLKYTPCFQRAKMYQEDRRTCISNGRDDDEPVHILRAELGHSTLKKCIESDLDTDIPEYKYTENGIEKRGARKLTNFVGGHPQLLPVKFPRFHFNAETGSQTKNSRTIAMERKLVLETPDGNKSTYRLVGYTVHHGQSIKRGHHTAVIQVGDKLYRQDDLSSHPTDDSVLKNAEPYLALYEKISD